MLETEVTKKCVAAVRASVWALVLAKKGAPIEVCEFRGKCVNTVRAHAYILPAKCADSIPSRLGVGSKKPIPHCLQAYGRSCCSLCVQIVTQSLWRVGTLEYIRPVRYAEKIPSRLGVLGKKLPPVVASKRRSGNDATSRPRSF